MADDAPLVFAPVLPHELEQEIFVTAAYIEPLAIPKFMLVAWRVKLWVEPLLYRVVMLSGSEADNALGLNAASWYPCRSDLFIQSLGSPSTLGESIHHLCLVSVDPDRIQPILSAASNVQDLWINNLTRDHWPIVSTMPLRRLHCSLEAFTLPKIDFRHPMFSQLTHFELTFVPHFTEDVWSAGLAAIPNLTHFAYNSDLELLSLSPTLLRGCESLRALIFLAMAHMPILARSTIDPHLKDLARDPRFVQLVCTRYVRDWQMGALKGIDYWARADEFISKRRSGEIDALQHLLHDRLSLSGKDVAPFLEALASPKNTYFPFVQTIASQAIPHQIIAGSAPLLHN
ncbi:hypothetical protein FB45DRAFT_1061880 [Roridomyces roridus]|uniref:Uncharacterized protein n=1 Tax=Roridomyces roridus TaxID=1738132 RepID=A0AAD7FIT0_9AGAR|nr:hypothetical protein FB45DRAFT_1061880 [Roridomyces roridus]